MPQTNNPKARGFIYPLSKLNEGGSLRLVRFRCSYCKGARHYLPADLILIFGDVDVDSLHRRMKCEDCNSGASLDVDSVTPTGQEMVGLRVRRLVRIDVRRVPVWREG